MHYETLLTTGAPTVLESHSAVTSAFTRALLGLGLRNSFAKILAEECTAAIASRQAVFLQGAFATRVAQALASVVGGPACARVAIPLGVQDGENLRHTIKLALRTNTGCIAAVAIEGLNRVALDLTRDVIADCVDPPANISLGDPTRTVVFATLSAGLASLPIEPEYVALGPVFDLSYLDWRTSPPSAQELSTTLLSPEADAAIQSQVTSVTANIEEAVRLAQQFVAKRNPTIERSIVRAYQALHLVRTEQQTVTPLQSLFYGWLLPYWRALDLPRDDIDAEVDGGKVYGAPIDPRLAAMFEAEFPAETGRTQ